MYDFRYAGLQTDLQLSIIDDELGNHRTRNLVRPRRRRRGNGDALPKVTSTFICCCFTLSLYLLNAAIEWSKPGV